MFVICSEAIVYLLFYNLHDCIFNHLSGDGFYIDLIFTNRKYSFKLSTTFGTSLSDHHHLLYLILKTNSRKRN